jgi:alpha-tubulin suppressor-like RCC1 family protein
VNKERAVLCNPDIERQVLPMPVEALRGARVGSIAASNWRSYAVTDTGELWAWGCDKEYSPLGHGEQSNCLLPQPIESLQGVKVDAVAAGYDLTLTMADDGSVYAWGHSGVAASGALGLGSSVVEEAENVPMPQRIQELRVACGL